MGETRSFASLCADAARCGTPVTVAGGGVAWSGRVLLAHGGQLVLDGARPDGLAVGDSVVVVVLVGGRAVSRGAVVTAGERLGVAVPEAEALADLRQHGRTGADGVRVQVADRRGGHPGRLVDRSAGGVGVELALVPPGALQPGVAAVVVVIDGPDPVARRGVVRHRTELAAGRVRIGVSWSASAG